MKTLDHSITNEYKFTPKEFAYIKSEMRKDGFKYDSWLSKFYIKDKYGKSYVTIHEAYERIAKFTVLHEITIALVKLGYKPTIANTGTLYIENLDVRVSNHTANGYFHSEKFGLNKYDFVVGAFTNPNDVLELIKSIN